jgi:hypothetical protein
MESKCKGSADDAVQDLSLLIFGNRTFTYLDQKEQPSVYSTTREFGQDFAWGLLEVTA